MGASLDKFKLDIRNAVEKVVPELTVLFHKKVHMELLGAIQRKSPRDTGRSMQSWQSGLQPSDEILINWEGRDAFRAAIGTLEGLQPYGVTYLWNNVHYIVYLEGGSSSQAPQGMVAVSITEMEAMFNVT